MTNGKNIEELAERCEKATGPDRELGCEILQACGWKGVVAFGHSWLRPDGKPLNSAYLPDPTKSLDAALTLVPPSAGMDASDERFRLESWTTNGVHAPHIRATAWVPGAKRVYAATPALALCAAALRARAASE